MEPEVGLLFGDAAMPSPDRVTINLHRELIPDHFHHDMNPLPRFDRKRGFIQHGVFFTPITVQRVVSLIALLGDHLIPFGLFGEFVEAELVGGDHRFGDVNEIVVDEELRKRITLDFDVVFVDHVLVVEVDFSERGMVIFFPLLAA